MLQRIIFLFLARSFYFLFLISLATQICGQEKPDKRAAEVLPLELNKTVERQFADETDRHIYQITLSANQYAKVIVEQRGVDVSAQVSAADGKPFADVDAQNTAQGTEIIELTTETAGDYRILIRHVLPKVFSGKYSIRLSETREATAIDKSLDEARRLSYESVRLNDSGKTAAAIESAQRAFEIREKVSGANQPETAISLQLLGTLYWNKDELAQAEIYFQRALKILAETSGKDDLLYADVIQGLAKVQHSNGDYSQSEQSSKTALSIREKITGQESLATANSLFALGLVYRVTNDVPKAERMYLRALAIREKLLGAEHLEVGLLLNNLGYLYYTVGDYPNAKSFYERSLAIKEKAQGKDSPLAGMTLINLGLVEWKRGDYQKAETVWKRALAIFEKSSGPESNSIAACLHNLGIVYKETGNYAKAEEYYERALAMWEKVFGKDHQRTAVAVSSLGILYRAMGDYDKAEGFHLRELAIYEKIYGANHPETAFSLDNLARLYAEKVNVPRALEYQKRVVAIEEKNIALSLSIGSERQKIAFFDTQLQKPDRIISLHARLAPDSIEARELAAAVILIRKGRILDALADNLAALRQRSDPQNQALIDKLNEANSRLSRVLLDGRGKTSLEDYQRQISILERRREDLESEVGRRSEGFYHESQPITLNAVRAAIPTDAALVEFAVYRPFDTKATDGKTAYGAARYIAYVIKNQGETRWAELGDKDSIDKTLDDFRKALRDPKQNDVKATARTADAQIMQPIRALLGDAKQLLISPDGELNLIPFEALVDEQNHYLIENYSVTYLTSGRDLLRLQTARASKSKSLLIANPQFGETVTEQTAQTGKTRKSFGSGKRQSITAARNMTDTYFAPLGGTAQEARSIQTLFPDATFLNGAQATETALKQTIAPQILHVATHGFFLEDKDSLNDKSTTATRDAKTNVETENPLLRSGLAFAGANSRGVSSGGDDGILTALEASGLNLWGTKLVVLSACDTGLGEIKNGEGVYGLRRAFTLAGTETMLMSLWAVSDYATRELMTNYYKNLKSGMGRGTALRQVQLEMLRKKGRTHPFYWAGFIQSGEWANLDGKR